MISAIKERIKSLFNDRRSAVISTLILLLSVIFCIILSAAKYSFAILPLVVLAVFAFLRLSFKNRPEIFKDIYLFILIFVEIVYFFQLLSIIDLAEEWSVVYLVNLLHNNMVFVTIPLVLAVYLIVRALADYRLTAIIIPIPFAVLTITDYYVAKFRGHELLFSDIKSIGTAVKTLGNYSFNPVIPIALILIPYFLTVVCAFNLEKNTSGRKIAIRIILALASVLSCTVYVKLLDNYFNQNKLETFFYHGSIANTFYNNFMGTALRSIIVKPSGYSTEALDSQCRDVTPSIPDDAPTIIVIMNESYTDLSLYSDVTGELDNPDPFWDSLTENTIHGYALASIYGSNTANSEFEFLTGLSMAYFPEGSVVYNQFIDEDIHALPRFLDSLGYHSTALHPYSSDGWNRLSVYPHLGFDEYHFLEDYDYSDEDAIRILPSDHFAYEDLLNRCASDSGLNFYFLITIQNHGGYGDNPNNFTAGDYISNPADADTNVFMSLINYSDEALEYLIDELSQSDEKYVVLIFGDHQPNLQLINRNPDFEPGGISWAIPYIIWTNYDMDPALQTSLDHTEDYTSINYLSLDLLRVAGISPDPYYDLLYRIRDEVPSINVAGYRLAGETAYHSLDEERMVPSLDTYDYLTYNVIFDDGNSIVCR